MEDQNSLSPSSSPPPPPPLPPPPPPRDEPDSKKLKMSTTTTTTTTTTTSDDEDRTTNSVSTEKKPRYKRRKVAILFAYCGVGYQGMQKNPGAKTIEGDLEEALYFSGAVPETDRGYPKRFDFARSARTDKGVSAVGQVVSGKFYVDPPGFVERLNNNLPSQFRIFGYKRVTASFSAKKFCDRRRYVYLLPVFALDPASHRDRESVLASLGSENELVKCLECSERGRKVLNTMGKPETGTITGSEVEIQSGISSNGLSALSDSDGKQENPTSLHNVNSKPVIVECKSLGTSSTSNEGCNINGVGNGVGDDIVKENVFRYGDKEKERFNKILKHYEGTHNFHNFTTRTKAADPSANRYIISFHANTTVTVDGIEFVKCEVVGQSFMLHQIRKMIGVAVAIMRNCAPESLMETALQQDVRISVPTAPEVGLYLDECFFTSYNQKWKDTHEEVSMKAYAEEAEEFKLKHIYSHIAATEHKEGAVAVWLHSLNHRNYPDLGPEENEVPEPQVEESIGCNRDLLDHLDSHNQKAKPSKKADPFLDLVASGRISVQPIHSYGLTTVVEIDLEHLATAMKDRLNLVLPFIPELCNRYNCGSETSITDTIMADVNMMVDTAISVTYNRLRHILELYNPTVCNTRMNPRSPGSNRSRTYGRAAPFNFIYGQFERLIDNLEAIGVPLATIDVKAVDRGGSFFSTIVPTHHDGLWGFIAPFHHSHYKHKDIVNAWFTLHDDPTICAFEDCSLRIECCTDPAVVDAVNATGPENAPDDLDGAMARTQPVGGRFPVNVFGIRSAVAAKGANAAVPAAVYIIGRGNKRYYCTSLARNLTQREMFSLLREFIFTPSYGSTSF
ncbi:tRNA pseudouridine synthase 1-like isoform X2 [Cynara cardunculus var. scolymus]|uniref:tRNA pseudouridine synthase 1-like isoform X2 n=1 Tax=Cynara cardunculus var. scolymus TaxID=59895 RepID=UPI000D62E93A|nr:tRNA pseudouridine synthase 1-like isoform X2 [Cynara cardunculus var. scolymus]